ncbi:hypothetical protein [Brevibacillus sp. SYP-B805]|uniref:hypothetical protein n=1 Tax=Brevibacillus sp. SYP-B805 TaxID=1578199 RepID=UPI001F49D481|nr:hypothetical protein [Brevibacillus sp. SYP-B805]
MTTLDGYALTEWEIGCGDWLAQPDWSTLRIIPWLEKTALVMADAVEEETGGMIPIAPRIVLKEQLNKAEARGYRFKMASELEFYLFRQTFEELYANGYTRMR